MGDSVSIGSSQVAAAAERGMLLFPTKTNGPEERSLNKTNSELKDMCRDYRLAVGGNKSMLTARLRVFSEKYCNDPASCDLKPAKGRSHKGPRQGANITQRVKQSAARRAAIIDTERVTERSKDHRPEDEIDELLAWADRSVARLPYEPPKLDCDQAAAIVPEQSPQGSDRSFGERIQIMETQLAVLSGRPDVPTQWISSSPAAETFPAYSTVPMDYVVYNHNAAQFPSTFQPAYNESCVFNIPTNVDWSYDPTYQSLHISNSAMASASAPPAVPATLANPIPSACGPARIIKSVPGAESAPCSIPPSAPTTTSTRSFELGNGVTINLTDDEIERLSVPAMSFAKDIDRLNEMWDDSSSHWKGNSIFQINGRSVALIHLSKFFKGNNWSAHKSTWTEWKFLVERYRQGTPEEFWREFSTANGSKMSYTTILDRLRKARQGSDAEVAERARLEYGSNFETTFTYRCSRTREIVVMTKPTAIAKMYRRLHALT